MKKRTQYFIDGKWVTQKRNEWDDVFEKAIKSAIEMDNLYWGKKTHLVNTPINERPIQDISQSKRFSR